LKADSFVLEAQCREINVPTNAPRNAMYSLLQNADFSLIVAEQPESNIQLGFYKYEYGRMKCHVVH
jgi:hypothetical protein